MKLPAILLLLILLLPAVVSAAAAPAIQPGRTVPEVTTTTTAVPVLSLVRVTETPLPFTCTAPAICISEQDAIAEWGENNYFRKSDESCGTPASPVLMYCYDGPLKGYGPKESDKYLENGRHRLDLPPAEPATTETTLVTVPATPLPKPTTLSAAGSPVQEGGAVTVVPVTTVTTPSAKPASIVDAVVGFFTSLFGGR